MKVTQEKLPASQVGLEIEIAPEVSKQAYEKTLQEFTRHANIPGFRKGKVPRQVLVQRFGATRLKAAALEELIQDSLKQALEQEKIEAIGNFELRAPFDDLIQRFEPGTSFTFEAAVDVSPDVVLNQYTGLEVKAEEIQPDPARVDQVLEDYRKRSATLVPVEERSAQMGDVATVDFVGRLVSDDADEPTEIPGGSAQDFEIELAEGRFIGGFVDGIVGMNPGERKEVSTTFPEDYPQEDLAGKVAVFEITLKELKERELPELDDDFAEEVSEFETLAELRDSLVSRFQKESEQRTKSNKQEALLNELINHLEVDLPETLIKQEVDYSITQTAMRLSQQGMDIKKTFTNDVVSMLRQQARPEAIDRLKRTLALGEIAKRESIKVEPDAVTAKMNEVLADYQDEEVDQERLRQIVEEDLLRDTILDWLEEHNSLELVPEGTLSPAEDEDEVSEAAAPETAVEASTATVDVVAEPAAEATASEGAVDADADTITDATDTTDAENELTATEPIAKPSESAKSGGKAAKSATEPAAKKSKSEKGKSGKQTS
jgi:trigger factor